MTKLRIFRRRGVWGPIGAWGYTSGAVTTRRVFFLIALTSLLSGCFGARRAVHRTVVDMEPLVIEVGEADTYRTFSPRDLLKEADADTDCSRAIARYREIVAQFPDSPQAVQATYNMGLCLEVEKKWRDAHTQYARALSMMNANDELALDARLRQAYCMEQLGDHDAAAKRYRKLSRHKNVPATLRLGARLREGIAYIHAGRRTKGERLLDRALKEAKQALSGLSDDIRASAAEAAYVKAEVAAAEYRALPLRMPAETLAHDLQEKTGALTVSRNAYVDAMGYRDAYWAASAAVEVGGLYEHLHDQMVGLPEPELPPQQLQIYRHEVERRLVPLRQHAFEAYLQVLLLGERVGFENDATRKARARVDALEPLLQQHVMSDVVVDPESDGESDAPDPSSDQGQERDVNGESDK